jgi:hypothetical protein
MQQRLQLPFACLCHSLELALTTPARIIPFVKPPAILAACSRAPHLLWSRTQKLFSAATTCNRALDEKIRASEVLLRWLSPAGFPGAVHSSSVNITWPKPTRSSYHPTTSPPGTRTPDPVEMQQKLLKSPMRLKVSQIVRMNGMMLSWRFSLNGKGF